MGIKSPQFDSRHGGSGGSDRWDDGLAGELLLVDFIGVGGTQLKYWDGGAWVSKPLKKWDGTNWVPVTLKRWNGSNWMDV